MEEKKLTVTFVNVGYGEAILLESPDPSKPDGVFTALIDGGSAEDSEFADRSSGRVRIEEYLEKRGIRRLDLAVSTATGSANAQTSALSPSPNNTGARRRLCRQPAQAD